LPSLCVPQEVGKVNKNRGKEFIMIFCSKCGKEVAEGVSFCPACGKVLQGQASNKEGNALFKHIRNHYMLNFSRRFFEDSLEVLGWLSLATFVIGGLVLGAIAGNEIVSFAGLIIGAVIGAAIGGAVCAVIMIWSYGVIAIFITMGNNIEKIDCNLNKLLRQEK
jgi:hypothetical protein